MGEEGHDQEFILIVEATGLDIEQVEALKKGFEGFDKVSSQMVFNRTDSRCFLSVLF
jgi:hypothetical protein